MITDNLQLVDTNTKEKILNLFFNNIHYNMYLLNLKSQDNLYYMNGVSDDYSNYKYGGFINEFIHISNYDYLIDIEKNIVYKNEID